MRSKQFFLFGQFSHREYVSYDGCWHSTVHQTAVQEIEKKKDSAHIFRKIFTHIIAQTYLFSVGWRNGKTDNCTSVAHLHWSTNWSTKTLSMWAIDAYRCSRIQYIWGCRYVRALQCLRRGSYENGMFQLLRVLILHILGTSLYLHLSEVSLPHKTTTSVRSLVQNYKETLKRNSVPSKCSCSC